jgi:hypothetical protein
LLNAVNIYICQRKRQNRGRQSVPLEVEEDEGVWFLSDASFARRVLSHQQRISRLLNPFLPGGEKSEVKRGAVFALSINAV